VIVAFLLAALAASVYVVVVLEILKLRFVRRRQLSGLRRERGAPEPGPGEVDEGVARELETGTFAAVDPETGELEAVDPDTGELELFDSS
jgi:hypothetical protein